MSERIRISGLGEHVWAVDVTEGTLTTHHRVTVPADLVDDLGLVDVDERRLVEESFAFLLEREKATQIYDEFPLDVIAANFPEYADELRTRLAG